jgi:hypothetical protein
VGSFAGGDWGGGAIAIPFADPPLATGVETSFAGSPHAATAKRSTTGGAMRTMEERSSCLSRFRRALHVPFAYPVGMKWSRRFGKRDSLAAALLALWLAGCAKSQDSEIARLEEKLKNKDEQLREKDDQIKTKDEKIDALYHELAKKPAPAVPTPPLPRLPSFADDLLDGFDSDFDAADAGPPDPKALEDLATAACACKDTACITSLAPRLLRILPLLRSGLGSGKSQATLLRLASCMGSFGLGQMPTALPSTNRLPQ